MGKLKYPQMQDRDWLHEQYVNQNKTMRQIADELGTFACVVLDALRKFKVPIRNSGHHFKGKKFSSDHSFKISQALSGKPKPWNLGKNNPNWQGGRTSVVQMERTTVRYKVWKDFVFNRDVLCVNCGSAKNRVAHHIKLYQEFPELKFDTDNGVVLCRSCHSSYHSSLSSKKRLIRRTSLVENAEPAGVIA